MSAMGIFRQLTSRASCKSFSLIDLPCLPAEKTAHGMAASTDLPAPPLLQKKFLPHVSSFACHFRFMFRGQERSTLRSGSIKAYKFDRRGFP
jgi:hypothetical protein